MKGKIEALEGVFEIQQNASQKYTFSLVWHKG
jgi:hypothetical protein